jgi:hypothetical protein
MDHDIHGFISLTVVLTALLVWTWVWTLDPDPAFQDVGEPSWVPPPNEPTNGHGASKFWAGGPTEDSLFFHGVLATPPDISR